MADFDFIVPATNREFLDTIARMRQEVADLAMRHYPPVYTFLPRVAAPPGTKGRRARRQARRRVRQMLARGQVYAFDRSLLEPKFIVHQPMYEGPGRTAREILWELWR